MKTSFHIILLCLAAFTFSIGCEKAELHKANQIDQAIEPRGPNCNNCPTGDCCCRVALDDDDEAYLIFCGTTNPELSEMVCEFDLEDCPDIDGFYWTTLLSTSLNDPDEYFCVSQFSSFMIGNLGGSPVDLTITCQVGQLSTQVLNITLGVGQRLYYTADGSCYLTGCHPS